MERELWPVLYRALVEVGRIVHQKNVTYQPWILVAVVIWAALHDRPPSWACKKENWSTTDDHPMELPSPSTVSRRAYGPGAALVWRELERRMRAADGAGESGETTMQEEPNESSVDGKPLLVGGYSKDPDAKLGKAVNAFGRGYRLHAIWSKRPMPDAWEVTPLNVAEPKVAEELVHQAATNTESPAGKITRILSADGNYDSSRLFDEAADAGYQLLVPVTSPGAGKGHHYQSPFRLRCIRLMQTDYGRELHAGRGRIERLLGNTTSFAGGLGPLPAWVRRQHRVRMWVWAKLLINAARIRRKQRLRL